MKAPANCRLVRWRIVEADLWDRDYLNLCGPATITITEQGGEIAFGALEAGLEGEGTAELLDDGTIEIEFAYRNGDEAILKAIRDPSSTAC